MMLRGRYVAAFLLVRSTYSGCRLSVSRGCADADKLPSRDIYAFPTRNKACH